MDSTFVLYMVGAMVLLALLWLVSRGGGRSISDVREIVGALVAAAEQVMPGVSGADKLEWVLSQADQVGITKHIDHALLRAMIESAVYWTKRTPK